MDISLRNYNRDNAPIVLRDCGDYYTLDCDGNKFYKEYVRIIGNYRNYPDAVDPPSGPFIGIGSVFEGKKVDMITWFEHEPIKFYLKDEVDKA